MADKVAGLQAAAAAEANKLLAAARSQHSALAAALETKAGAVTALQARFTADLEAAWAEYRDTYAQLAALEQVKGGGGGGRAGASLVQAGAFTCGDRSLVGQAGQCTSREVCSGVPAALLQNRVARVSSQVYTCGQFFTLRQLICTVYHAGVCLAVLIVCCLAPCCPGLAFHRQPALQLLSSRSGCGARWRLRSRRRQPWWRALPPSWHPCSGRPASCQASPTC